jgi:hypothetical protein
VFAKGATQELGLGFIEQGRGESEGDDRALAINGHGGGSAAWTAIRGGLKERKRKGD